MTAREALLRDYRAAFLRYLSWHEESALHSGYQLGRGHDAGRVVQEPGPRRAMS
jgi:hypothetical protein